MVYEFEMWVMAHSAGVDVVLGTDFMIPAGIRLDLFHGAAQLPNEIRIPLVKTKNMIDSKEYGSHVNAGPSEQLDIPGHEWREYRLSKRQVALERHILWVGRTEKIILSLTRFRRGQPQRIKLTNVSDRTVYFTVHDTIAVLVPSGDLPRGDGYVRQDSKKYRDWQVLAYQGCRDREQFQHKCGLYEQLLAAQPPSVEHPDYPEPQGLATRPPQDSLERPGDRLTCVERWDKIMEGRARTEATQTSVLLPTTTVVDSSVARFFDLRLRPTAANVVAAAGALDSSSTTTLCSPAGTVRRNHIPELRYYPRSAPY
ncbi:hypothetical protein PC118_g17361 [Phytophthora cactorum]|uniref:Uncharacterized protein n=1 Tax=Phytophthora cactorum TaxID=29920 RepID=A0A8T1FC55_9STRA|nr:hypothetical protein PC118_g17361 [Phytophthora cactorum]